MACDLRIAAETARLGFREHWLGLISDWVCYGAPVHGPDGSQVGVIDLSTSWTHANPLGQTTVASMARLVEHERGPAPITRVVDPSVACDREKLGPGRAE